MLLKRMGLMMIAAMLSLVVASCSEDTSGQGAYNGYLALLNSRIDDVGTAAGEDLGVPDDVLALLAAAGFVGSTGDGSGAAARGGTTDLGAEDWLVGLVQGNVYLNGGEDTFYGTLGVGFRPGEQLEVFIFFVESYGSGGADAVYIDDLNAENLGGHVFVGGGNYYVENATEPVYVRNDCDFGTKAARGDGGPYYGLWVQTLDAGVSLAFDPPMLGPPTFTLDIPDTVPSALMTNTTVRGVYALDACIL